MIKSCSNIRSTVITNLLNSFVQKVTSKLISSMSDCLKSSFVVRLLNRLEAKVWLSMTSDKITQPLSQVVGNMIKPMILE